MKKVFFQLPAIAFFFLTGCTTSTPEDYFDIAVLNCNFIQGFAGAGLQRELDDPTVKLVEGTKNETVPMTRKEVIESKTQTIQANFEKIKQLKQTEETRAMLQSSIALYEYVLPVYKNEYQQLARLYDEAAPKEQIESMHQQIESKYYSNYEKLFNALTTVAKPYAAKNNIQVQWDVSTSPQ